MQLGFVNTAAFAVASVFGWTHEHNSGRCRAGFILILAFDTWGGVGAPGIYVGGRAAELPGTVTGGRMEGVKGSCLLQKCVSSGGADVHGALCAS